MKRKDLKKILLLGAGPIVRGQGCEFDYSGCQAVKALRREGYKIILVNGNVREASDSLASRVYFDQQGVISRRLQLTYIPARVVQDGRRLKITSAALPHE